MGSAKGLGKVVLLLILIVILILFGIFWFDFIGVISAKSMFAPVLKVFGFQPQTSISASTSKELVLADLENDRYEKLLEGYESRVQELDKREADIKIQEENNAQIALELQDRINSQEEREKTFNNQQKKYDDKRVNIEQIVGQLNKMDPTSAVNILEAMDDQVIIEAFRVADEIAVSSNTASMVSVWQMRMKPERVAELNRKMVNKPSSL